MRATRILVLSLALSLTLAACAGATATPPPAAAPATQPPAGNASVPPPATAPVTATLVLPTPLPAGCRAVAHDIAITTVCGTPQRVVALGPHMLDMVLSLGIQPVGFGGMIDLGLDTFTDPGIQIPYQGQYITGTIAEVGSRIKLDYPALERLKPDLILGEDIKQVVAQYPQLSAIAPTLLFSADGHHEWQDTLSYVADALGRSNRVPAVIQAYERKLAATQRALTKILAEQPTVALVALDATTLKEFVVIPSANDFVGGMLTDLGFKVVRPAVSGIDAGMDSEIWYPNLSYLADLDPDMVLVLAYSADPPLEKRSTAFGPDTPYYDVAAVADVWPTVPELAAMRASKDRTVYFVDYYPWSNIQAPQAATYVLDDLVRRLTRP